MKTLWQQEDRRVAGGLGGTAGRGRGFTMVEIMTSVAIIAILAAMFLLGFKYVGASSKAKKTQVRLETLRNMLNEFEVKGGRMRLIDDRYAKPVAGGWSVADRQTLPKGNIGESSALRFSGDLAITRTQEVMRILIAVPENRSLLNSMPPEALMDSNTTDPADPTGKKVLKMNPPILVDAWNNPILFGPRRAIPWATVSNVPPTVAPPVSSTLKWGVTGLTSPTADYQPVDGKGIWASAGPDEDFSLGDDNLYSDNAK